MVTYTPFKALHGAKIEDDGNAEINVERYSGTNLRIQSQASAGRIETTTAHPLWLGANGSGRIEIQSGGLVSIPGALTVSGTFNATLATAAQTNITSVGSLTSLDVNGDTTISGTLSLDGSANELRFYEGSNYVGFEAPALSADQIWVLPAADGSANQALTTDGSGNFQWSSASSIAGAGSNLSLANGTNNRIVTAVDGSNLNGEANLTFNGSTLTVAGDMLVNNNGSIKANGSGSLLLGNTNAGLIKVHGGTGSSIVEGHSNHLVLQTVRDSDDIIFNVNAGGTDSDTTVVEAMRIHGPDANIGIGTTSPEYTLDVQDGSVRILPTISSNAGTAIRIGARGNSNDITLLRIDGEGSGADGAGNSGESDSAKYGFSMKYMGSGSGEGNRYAMFMDNQAGSAIEAMSILQGGNVGIGTTSPSSELEVAGNTTGNVAITIDNDNTAGLGSFMLQEDGTTTGIFQYRGSTNGTLPNTVRVGSNVAGGNLAFTYAGGTTGMYLKGSNGYLGIGSSFTSPSSSLHVSGADTILTVEDTSIGVSLLSRTMAGIDIISGGMNASSAQYGSAIKFLSHDDQLTTENPKFLAAIVPRATQTYDGDDDGGMALDFAVTDNTPGTTNVPVVNMTVDHTGYVGIGTTHPARKLHVQGSANDEVVALFTTVGGTSGSTQGKAHIGLSHFSSDSTPSVTISAEEIDASDHRADLVLSTRGSASSNATPTEKLRITHDGSIKSPLTNLNTCVTFVFNRSDMGTGAVNLKAVSNDYSSTQNQWGFIMPKSGRIKYITLNTRNHTVTSTNVQTWKINNNNDMSTSGEFFAFDVGVGLTQNDTGVNVNASMNLAVAPHSSTIYRGSMVVNHSFDALDEIRIQRTDANGVNMGDCSGVIYVEFD